MLPVRGHISIRDSRISSFREMFATTIENGKETLSFPEGWIYPGFTDSHGHIFGLGQKLFALNLEQCKSEDECVHLAINFHERRGEWLTGRGWNQELWDKKVYPGKKKLDEAFPDTPVSLNRVDGHCLWVNSRALELAGIDRHTSDPPGGQILRDSSGYPNGILLDNAMSLVSTLIPRHSDENIRKYILAANDELLKNGITEVHDMDVSPLLLETFKILDLENQLKIRIQTFVQAQENEWKKAGVEPFKENMLNIAGLKFYADGALGSHGAALLTPYDDKPETSGLMLIDDDTLFKKASKGIEAGFQIATHAIGDRANRIVIKAYEKLRKIYPDAVLRIEHAQMVHPDDVQKIAENNIYCAVQPIHCTSDTKMARIRTGERNKYSYPWKSLIDAGIIIGGGSDFPIESHNPVIGLDAFINRIPFSEIESWVPGQRISATEALDAYTFNAHKLSCNDDERGIIEQGRQADITILNRDITKISHDEFKQVKVLATIVNGEIMYLNKELT